MIRFLLALLLLVPAARAACTKITMPTDFAVVTNGTRANLKANFTEIETRVEPCMDSVDEIRGRFSGYSSSLLMSSLENMRLKLDSDASATALFLVENGSGDSLFRVSEDSTAKFFGTVTLNNLTASLPLFTSSTKGITTNAMTGTGNVVMSSSPTLTGTLTAATVTASGNITISSPSALLVNHNSASDLGGTYVFQGSRNDEVILSASSYGTGVSGALVGRRARGTFASQAAVQSGDNLLYIGGYGHNGTAIQTSASALISLTAIETWSGSAQGTRITLGTTPAGSTTRATVADFASAGITFTPAVTLTAAPVFSSVTASEFLLVDGSKALTSVAGTGTGSVMRAASPTTTGTLTAAAINASGTVTADSLISSKFYEEGSFTLTMTGFSGTVNGTAYYVRTGKTVSLLVPGLNGTSNATTKTFTGIPAGIRPAQAQAFPFACTDNSAASATMCLGLLLTDGTATLYKDATLGNSWTASGTAGLTYATNFHYNIKQ